MYSFKMYSLLKMGIVQPATLVVAPVAGSQTLANVDGWVSPTSSKNIIGIFLNISCKTQIKEKYIIFLLQDVASFANVIAITYVKTHI